MSTLTFNYGTMTSGKTTALLLEAHSFRNHGLTVYLLTSQGDTRSGQGVIKSRIGISSYADVFVAGENVFEKIAKSHAGRAINMVFVDEAQFLSRDQVWQLSDVVDRLQIPVSAYGLRSDFRGTLFEGSAALMSIADVLTENTAICSSGEKANMVLRLDCHGRATIDGPQVMIGGEDVYTAVSRKTWKRRVADAAPVVLKSVGST